LAGIFQRVLPRVYEKILIAAKHGADGAEWSFQADSFGVRAVHHLSYDSGLPMKSKTELAAEKAKRVPVFVIGDSPPLLRDDEDDVHADEHVARYADYYE
jgi:CTP:molybdopterin cytidylyltransferase MocA